MKFFLSEYIEQAMNQAEFDKLEDKSFSGRIPACKCKKNKKPEVQISCIRTIFRLFRVDALKRLSQKPKNKYLLKHTHLLGGFAIFAALRFSFSS